MPRVIIADTSCLIVLDNIGELDLLSKLYEEVIITPEIASEFGKELPGWINLQKVLDDQKMKILELELDKGESSAIALCLEKAQSLLIIDERKGRSVAQRLGIKITGTLGVILKCKKLGIVNSVEEIITKLASNNFRISNSLKDAILKEASEK